MPRPERLGRIAEDLGALDDVAQQLRTYARHRRAWHAYLARHEVLTAVREEDLLYDPLDDEYWLPPPDLVDDSAWTLVDAAA
ncbi:hypothetical protein ET495_17315 (plasmid) [Xylanimonas allomyrinae]|uniref:Uncharacterized protein n=1 Tax=Xylanimonas allomyrinae TaxID=2509459 RepID=A0A4V0YEQ0_9MICO|nr:hypothetical protein [Xylanimonas allomyrinae]QAY64981.1 hypothetical protein ET495_17315 [Xylanimonas allomyrinae]